MPDVPTQMYLIAKAWAGAMALDVPYFPYLRPGLASICMWLEYFRHASDEQRASDEMFVAWYVNVICHANRYSEFVMEVQ